MCCPPIRERTLVKVVNFRIAGNGLLIIPFSGQKNKNLAKY
jgi:hypothetical protein